jgi:S1-C subfamily serine protease
MPQPIRREAQLLPDGKGGWKFGVQVKDTPGGEGVQVAGLTPKGPAERLGVEVEDVIVGVNGQRARNRDDYARLLDASPQGKARFEIIDRRNRAPETREVLLGPNK